MKKCIFCLDEKPCKEFNREHIIPHALGARGIDDIIDAVCANCNSKIGSIIEEKMFLSHNLTKTIRYWLSIKSRKGIVPNPLENISVNYADTPITGKIITNNDGHITAFRADYGLYKFDNGLEIVVGARKDIAGYYNSIRKSRGLSSLNYDELEKVKLQIPNDKTPYIKKK